MLKERLTAPVTTPVDFHAVNLTQTGDSGEGGGVSDRGRGALFRRDRIKSPVSARCANVRLGEQVAGHDRGAYRAEFRMAMIVALFSFRGRRRPGIPRDLTETTCINLRLPTPVPGARAVFNAAAVIPDAAFESLGLA